MKIGIDIRTATGSKAGKGWYTWHLVKELLRLDKKNGYILYTNAISADLAVMHNTHIKLIHRNPVLWHTAVIKDWKKEIGHDRFGQAGNLFFAPTSYIIPALLPKEYPSVITVHDLVAFLHPHLHQFKATVVEKFLLKRALRKTRHVLVPSENTKKDLMRLFRYPEEKITVTPLGVDEVFREEGRGARDEGKAALVRKKYNLSDEFILTVSGLEPRKNVSTLIDGVAQVRKKHPRIKLVILGGKGWKSKKTQKKIAKRKDFVIHLEHCTPEELPFFYHLAKIFVFPSLYEGFGLPPLEALASGCPVICSNTSSLQEVVGDAGLFFAPQDVPTLQTHIEKLLTDELLRKQLIKKGAAQASHFSWKDTAKKTLAVFNSIL